jgi:hypothetical protein
LAVDPAKVALFIPPGLKKFKLNLFERIGSKIERAGGRTVRHEFALLDKLPDDVIPIVGCTPELRPLIDRWRARGRQWIYWDRGYARRVFATWLPKGENGGYYRWHLGSFQCQSIRDVPQARWDALQTPVAPWARAGSHIVIAAPTATYSRFHGTQNWVAETIDALARVTDRQLVIRDKESKRPLQADLKGAHCLVSHGSIAAVEAAVMGCPVFVSADSAAALVGLTDLNKIESPIYPDRQSWLNTLAFSQFNETELVDGTLWRMIE